MITEGEGCILRLHFFHLFPQSLTQKTEDPLESYGTDLQLFGMEYCNGFSQFTRLAFFSAVDGGHVSLQSIGLYLL